MQTQVCSQGVKRTRMTCDDVEPSDVTSESNVAVSEDVDYRRKKLMSASIFRHTIEVDTAKEEDSAIHIRCCGKDIIETLYGIR